MTPTVKGRGAVVPADGGSPPRPWVVPAAGPVPSARRKDGFIAADSPSKPLAFVTLGLCFVTTGTLWCLGLAWFSSLLGERLRGSRTFAEILNRTAGALFILLGVRLATTK